MLLLRTSVGGGTMTERVYVVTYGVWPEDVVLDSVHRSRTLAKAAADREFLKGYGGGKITEMPLDIIDDSQDRNLTHA